MCNFGEKKVTWKLLIPLSRIPSFKHNLYSECHYTIGRKQLVIGVTSIHTDDGRKSSSHTAH